MRVLVIPELYRRGDPSANGTLSDAVTWTSDWLTRDPTLHVYWLLPNEESHEYACDCVPTNCKRVTVIDGAPLLNDFERTELFSEGGYSSEQLAALQGRFHSSWEYVDVVVDQLRTGRFTLYKWLLEGTDQWAAAVRPFDVIANVHDLQFLFKHRYCSYRNAFQMWMEMAGALFADGIWFTASVDAERMRERATECFHPKLVDAALDSAIETGSPIDFGAYEEHYAETPTTLHLAGSLWNKKHPSCLIDVGQTLFERYGIQTVMTSMEPIPDEYRRADWVETHPEASRATYDRALERGDLAVCASEYETMARTPFEQAASGQVLLLRDEPWIYDCVPEAYRLAGTLDDLPNLAVWVVEHWETAVEENCRLVEHAKRKRRPERTGERTYADLRRCVDAKLSVYETGKQAEIVERAADDLGRSFALDSLAERTAEYTEDGPLTEHNSYAPIDLVYTLRALGYEDIGNPGTPKFRRAESNRATSRV